MSIAGRVPCRIYSLFLLFCLVSAFPTQAALQIWSGASLTTSNWSDPLNWQSLSTPANGDDLIFPPGALGQTNRNDLAAETSLNSITFSGAGYLASGNSVRLVNGIQAQNSTGTNTFQPVITLSGPQTFTCFAAAATLALGGDIRLGANTLTVAGQGSTRLTGVVSGSGGLVKNGAGRLVLAGNSPNTHTGTNQVNAGVLELRKNPPAGALAIPGPLVIGDGLGNPSNDVVRLYSSNQLSSSSSVRVTRSGLLDLTNSSSPVFSLLLEDGNVASSGGALHVQDHVLANTTAQGSHISGVMSLASGLRSFTINHSGTSPGLQVSASIIDGLTGSGIVKNGDGTLTLASSNSYSGQTIVNAGVLQVQHSWALGHTNEGTWVSSGTTLLISSNARVPSEPLVMEGDGFDGLGVLRSSGALSAWGGDIILTNDCTIAVIMPSDSLLLSGAISGPGGFKKTLDGVLTLGGTNSNSYAGATFVEAGVLRLTKSGSIAIPGPFIIGDDLVGATNDVVTLLAPSQINDNAPISVRSSGLLELSGNSDVIGPLTLEGGRVTTTTGILALNGDVTALESLAGPASISGQLSLGPTNRIFHVPDPATTLNVLAHISGDPLVALIKTGAGTLRFAGSTGNTYGGSTSVREGTLLLERSSGLVVIPGPLFIGDGSGTDVVRFGASHQIADAALVNLGHSGVLDFAGQSETIGALDGYGYVNISNVVLITGGNNTSTHFAGTLAGVGGMLVKRGSGVFTLSGNNSYTGATRVDAGELRVNGSQPLSDVSLHNGALLGGTGGVGRVSITRGIIAPGVSPGILRSRDITLSSVGTYRLDLSGPGPGTGHDQISVAGIIDLANAVLDLRVPPSFAPTEGMTFPIINNDGSDLITGTFANLPQGATLNIGGLVFRVSYVGGDGNDVVLTLEDVAVAAETLAIAAGNGDRAVDRSECNELYIALSNPGTSPLRNVHVLLVPLNDGATVTQPLAFYGDIPPGAAVTNRTPFQLRTSADFVCDPGPAGVQFYLLVTSSNFSSFIISMALPAGCADGTGECEGCPNVLVGNISAADAVQNGQLNRGVASSCAVAKACPDVINNTASFHYDAYTFTNSSSNRLCITVTLNAACGTVFAAAYAGSFTPANPCANYLADIGTEPNPTGAFSFIVPGHEQFVIVVHESQADTGCASYTLSVAGLECSQPTLSITALSDINAVRLAWTTASPGYGLQGVASLESSWTNVINPPVVSAGKYVVTNEAGAPSYFYRLQKR